MKAMKEIVLGTTRRGKAFRAAALCTAAIAVISSLAFMTQTPTQQDLSDKTLLEETTTKTASPFALESADKTSRLAGADEKTTQADSEPKDESAAANEGATPGEGASTSKASMTEKPLAWSQDNSGSSAPSDNPSTSAVAPSQQPSSNQSASGSQPESAPTRVHNWIDKTETVHHDAVYETVWHDPVYETRTTYHDVCVQCGAILDGGLAGQHLKNGSCTNYRTGVPFTEQVLVSDGYSEQVLVQPAWDETVVVGKYCSCGAAA